MGCIYFSVPVVGGYFVMQWAIAKSHDSIGPNGERLPVKQIQGIGDKRVGSDGKVLSTVGAGGWGGGVRLSVSDEEVQRKNKRKLERFLKQQKRKQENERDAVS